MAAGRKAGSRTSRGPLDESGGRRGGPLKEPEPRTEAVAVLDRISAEAALRGGKGSIKGGYTCVCFTEAPLAEMVSVFCVRRVGGAGTTIRTLWRRRLTWADAR